MKNNKGQALVVFVVFLPVLIILFASSIDIGLMYLESNKLNNVNKYILEYGLSNLDDENLEGDLVKLIEKNIDEIKEKKLYVSNNEIKIELYKEVNSTFGRIIGLDKYDVVSKYTGTINNGKIKIKRVRG